MAVSGAFALFSYAIFSLANSIFDQNMANIRGNIGLKFVYVSYITKNRTTVKGLDNGSTTCTMIGQPHTNGLIEFLGPHMIVFCLFVLRNIGIVSYVVIIKCLTNEFIDS